MKIKIVGGGPAGLFFAILMKRDYPKYEITIFEKGASSARSGWGLVFSANSLRKIAASDEITFNRLLAASSHWQDVVVAKEEEKIRIRGNPFAGIRRDTLLRILRHRCESLGVRIKYNCAISNPSEIRDYDLLIGADGVGSIVRKTWKGKFQPSTTIGKNRYIWLGTHKLFDGLTMGFTQSSYGPLAAHAYRFDENHSTFIVECSENTWRNLSQSPNNHLENLAHSFHSLLDGKAILENNSRWANFATVKNLQWSHENITLLGDALHTAHFSIGSGTKMAFDDAIALSVAMKNTSSSSIRESLKLFESLRRPKVEKLQSAAKQSQEWFERFPVEMTSDLPILAHSNMTRSGRIDDETLRKIDPQFLMKYLAAKQKLFMGKQSQPYASNFERR